MVGSGRGGRAASARPLFIKIGSAGDILGFVIEKEREEVTRGRRRPEGRLLREVVPHRVRDKVSLDQGYAMPSSSFSSTGDAMRSSSATSSTRCRSSVAILASRFDVAYGLRAPDRPTTHGSVGRSGAGTILVGAASSTSFPP